MFPFDDDNGFSEEKKIPFPNDRGKITNIDYQTDWIYKEIQKTNNLLAQTNELILDEIKWNRYLIRLIEHALEKSDNPAKMREAISLEMHRGPRW